MARHGASVRVGGRGRGIAANSVHVATRVATHACAEHTENAISKVPTSREIPSRTRPCTAGRLCTAADNVFWPRICACSLVSYRRLAVHGTEEN